MTKLADTSKHDKKESNRKHHLSFYEDTYADYPQRIAEDLMRLAELHRRFDAYHHRMKIIDQNRRENAFHMGVSIQESDAKYSFDTMLQAIPEIIKSMLEWEKKYNVKLGDIRALDKKAVI